jgi:hypothetical protein
MFLELTYWQWAVVVSIVFLGGAILLHVSKEAREAHGLHRN